MSFVAAERSLDSSLSESDGAPGSDTGLVGRPAMIDAENVNAGARFVPELSSHGRSIMTFRNFPIQFSSAEGSVKLVSLNASPSVKSSAFRRHSSDWYFCGGHSRRLG
jgi:hypothetical protein